MFSKHPAITRLLSKVKKLLRMSSTIPYTGYEVFDDTTPNTALYKKSLLDNYRSLEDAEGCRICEVVGWKEKKRSEHEFVVVSIIRGDQKAYVVFERGPDLDTPRQSLSSLSVASPGSSTTSVTSSALASSLPFGADDKVKFASSGDFQSRAKRIWRITFKNYPPFYIAVNIATTIFASFPDYVVSKTNCYFFTHVFHTMLLKECNDCMPTVQEGSTSAGHTLGVPFWSPPLTPEQLELRFKAAFDEQIKDFRKKLTEKAALTAKERHERDEVVRQEERDQHKVELDRVKEELKRQMEEKDRESKRKMEEKDRELEELRKFKLLASMGTTTAGAQSCE
ncbi:hypothetical protein C0992_000086 [Termitomyces sp. T32_za158]|nr:hypothetical protein C0992_000086 [Termitomyces sp. T32_za158]